jgi:hypothetical protein
MSSSEDSGFDTSKLTFQANPTTLGNPSIDTQFGLTTWLDSGDRFTGVATITEVGAMTQDLQMSATPASYASYVQK